LKPENILLDEDFNIKLADFGYSKIFSANKNGILNTPIGTLGYMAPEIYLQNGYNGATVDLFAAGVILFILVAGFPAFEEAVPTD